MVIERARSTHRPRRYAVAAGLLTALLATGAAPLDGPFSIPAAGAAAPAAGVTGEAVAGPTPDGAATGDGGASTTGPDGATETARPQTQADARPRLVPLGRPLSPVADGPVPDPAALSEAISGALDSEWLGPRDRRAVTVRDALTGQVLAESNARRPVTPASTTKILSAAAIVTALSGEQTFTTRVVSGTTPDEVVLVAGGDMLLGRGDSNPGAVAGRAGVADLAAQTAEALEGRAVAGPVSVRLDLQYLAGPHKLETWTDFWLDEGFAGRIVQLGLAEDLALPTLPSPTEPEQEVARAFASALEEAGVEVAGWEGDDAAGDWSAEVVETAAGTAGLTPPGEAGPDGDAASASPGGAATGDPGATETLASVESAALRDVLALALAASDNAMVEQLARQAAVADGEGADQESVTAWIERSVVEDYGIDLEGMQIADASGLSDGTRLTVDVVADLLVAGADGSHPDLQAVLAAGGLPIAGYSGTLSTRFHLPVHVPAVGNARAKTGSLPGVTSLAGTVVTADGRLLVYALTADDIGDGGAVLEARSSVDAVVAQLAGCGC